MITIKKTVQDRFTITPKEIFENNDISWKAKGMLAWITSHSDNYVLRAETIINFSKEGRDSVYATLKELENAGFLYKIQTRSNGKITGTEYYAAQESLTNEEWVRLAYSPLNSTACGFSVSGFSVSGKSDTKNTNSKNTNNNNNIYIPEYPDIEKWFVEHEALTDIVGTEKAIDLSRDFYLYNHERNWLISSNPVTNWRTLASRWLIQQEKIGNLELTA